MNEKDEMPFDVVELFEQLNRLYTERKQILFALEHDHMEAYYIQAAKTCLEEVDERISDLWTQINTIRGKRKKKIKITYE